MHSLRIFLRIALASILLFVALATEFVSGQVQPTERPNFQPGDRLEVMEGGAVKDAEFVEFTPVGLIKVRFEDDSQRAFRPNFVRLPKGAKPRPAAKPMETAAPAAGSPVASGAGTNKRTWTDASGKFKIDAEFLGLSDAGVQLKKEDGKIVTLPLDKLAAADQEIAKLLAVVAAKATPAKEPENPFEANVTAGPVKPAGVAPATGATTKVTLQGVPTITLDAPASWTATVNPPSAAPPVIGNRTSTIPSRSAGGRNDDFFERAERMIVDTAHSWMWIGVRNEPPGNKEKSCRLERIDLVKGTVLPPIALPSMMKPLAVDPTGRYLATLREDDFHNRSKQLDLWEVEGDQVRPAHTFTPYDRGDGKPNSINSVKWGEFVDGTHLLTLSDNGALVLWNLATLKAEYLIELGGWSSGCTLSPGRKHLAIATSSGVYMLDALSGNVLGKFEMNGEGSANLMIYRVAFSDDGSKVAALGPLNLWVWNVADGKNTTSISGTSLPIGSDAALSFGQKNHVIIDHRYAFDIERGLMTCHYSGSWSAAAAFAGREWYLTEERTAGGKVRGLMQFVLPGDDVTRKAATVKEEELLAIKPGSRIGLSLNLPFDPAEIEKIRTSATAHFKGNGWVVVADGEASDFTLECSTSQGESKEISYRMFGRGFETTKVTITYQHGEMKLTAPGVEKPVWQSKTTWGPPHFIHLKEGQTIEEATRTSPNANYFANPAIPRRLMKYPNGLSIVSADLSPKGVTVR